MSFHSLHKNNFREGKLQFGRKDFGFCASGPGDSLCSWVTYANGQETLKPFFLISSSPTLYFIFPWRTKIPKYIKQTLRTPLVPCPRETSRGRTLCKRDSSPKRLGQMHAWMGIWMRNACLSSVEYFFLLELALWTTLEASIYTIDLVPCYRADLSFSTDILAPLLFTLASLITPQTGQTSKPLL